MLKPQWHGFSFHLYWYWPVGDFFGGLLPPESVRVILNYVPSCGKSYLPATLHLGIFVFSFVLMVSHLISQSSKTLENCRLRTANRFLIWFFPRGLFLSSFRIIHMYSCGYDTRQINTYFFEFLLCTLNCAKFNQGLHTSTQTTLVLILKNFITYLGREIIDMCVVSNNVRFK